MALGKDCTIEADFQWPVGSMSSRNTRIGGNALRRSPVRLMGSHTEIPVKDAGALRCDYAL